MERIETAWKEDQIERNGRWGDIQDYRNMLRKIRVRFGVWI